ncbi:ABC transporter permease [Neomicrococcus lactis]|uniref:Transport permease protein n=1 Tax=Neomicrococcus lactis TaxID=732241 RepID=A0A7W9DAY7_9MICC|nr:ABC transporter permease [Neomicrococcus lactis]MBB5597531.1 teichoic acid transport system permease protein [Neomicrococcus lactis]
MSPTGQDPTTSQPDESSSNSSVKEYSIDPAKLLRVGARPGFWAYLKEIWRYRSFIYFDSQARVAAGHDEDRLGKVWLVLNPILNGATYYFVFGLLLGTGSGVPNFLGYLIIGTFMFRFTTQGIISGARSINNNKSVVQAFNFPRATLPVAANLREFMANVPAYVVMIILILAIPPVEKITWLWLLFIPLVAVQFLFNLGLSLVLARIVTRFSDFIHIISFGTRIWLYLSAVFFAADRFADHPVLMAFMHANPMYCVLEIARDALLYGTLPALNRWLVLIAWTVVLLIIGSWVFWRAEESYGRES